MTRRARGTGPDLTSALVDAVAQLVDCEPEKVDLRVDAPGLDAVEGSFTLELQVRTSDEAVPPVTAEDVPSSATRDSLEPDRRDQAPEHDDPEIDLAALDEEADAAADFLEGLLDAMELPGDLRIRIADDHAEVEVVDAAGGVLIGRRGQTLEAVQELLRCALQREFERRCRVMIDVEGYRARRLEKVIEKAQEAIDDVLDGGDGDRLEPMDVFERKAVHQLVTGVSGVTSHSQGHEPARRVVIEPE